ncbi:hypothetical protein MMC11_002160 [Xylographa trunciseda]|nr:hypothetical protein [Xylographa trunciseda]
MAGISIFFITTYFSDYILVPLKSRSAVIRTLEARGFVFEKSAEAYVNVAAHHRNASSTSSFEVLPPTTPPPTTVSELQARTFALLRRRAIVPHVHRDIRLVQCAGRRDSLGGEHSPSSAPDLQLQIGLTRCIVHPPRFFSVTLTEAEPPSLLLERRSLRLFGGPDVLLGSKHDVLIPITLNLEPLPFEATGIVCGVAGKLVGGRADGGAGRVLRPVEMSYLSTARAGTVMVDEEDLERAVELLNAGEFGLDVE